jgi:hypothetical protein
MNYRAQFCILVILVVGVFGCNHSPTAGTPAITEQDHFTQQIQVPVQAKILEINHQSGDVSVIGWEKPFILIEGTKRVVADDAQRVRMAAEAIQLVAFQKNPDRLALEYHGPGSSSSVKVDEKGIQFVAHVPKHLALDMDIRHGKVSVANMDNHVSIDHRNGDVTVEGIQGKVQIRSKEGAIRVASVARSLKLDTRKGPVDVKKVGESLAIQHQYGEIRVEDVGGGVVLNCYETSILISDVKGRLEIDNRRGDVECRRFQDALDVYINHGTLKADAERLLSNSYYCRVDNGDVILRIQEESSALFDVNVENGRIHSDFYMPVWAEGKISVAKGAMKDGRNYVSCFVRKGSVSLLKAVGHIQELNEDAPAPAESTAVPEPQKTRNGLTPARIGG